MPRRVIVSRHPLGEPEPPRRLTPQQAVAEVERLRRLFTERFGDPDQPIAKVVLRRRLSDDPPPPP